MVAFCVFEGRGERPARDGERSSGRHPPDHGVWAPRTLSKLILSAIVILANDRVKGATVREEVMQFIGHHQTQIVEHVFGVPRIWVVIGLVAFAWAPVLGFLALIA